MPRKTFDYPLNQVSQNEIIRSVSARILDAENWLSRSMPKLDVYFDISGTAWAYYQRKNNQRCIRFNPYLVADHLEETYSDVIPHEVAHFVVDSYYSRRCRPHGSEWKAVMSHFGIRNPSIRHNKDLSNVPVRRQNRHRYACDCQQHLLTTTRHNRIQRGLQSYACLKCGSSLRFC